MSSMHRAIENLFSLRTQIGYLVLELQRDYKPLSNKLSPPKSRSGKLDEKELAALFMKRFEKPQDEGTTNTSKRQKYAQEALKVYDDALKPAAARTLTSSQPAPR